MRGHGCWKSIAEWSYKPGSVRYRAVIIPLGRRLPAGSSGLPGDGRGPRPDASLFGLAADGVYPAFARYRAKRCALTAPFHPDRQSACRRSVFCGTFPGSPPPDVIRHPALRSPDFPRAVGPHAITRTTPRPQASKPLRISPEMGQTLSSTSVALCVFCRRMPPLSRGGNGFGV